MRNCDVIRGIPLYGQKCGLSGVYTREKGAQLRGAWGEFTPSPAPERRAGRQYGRG